jgi:hypothetical protein
MVQGLETIAKQNVLRLDQWTFLASQCLHSAEAGVQFPRRTSGFDPEPTNRNVRCQVRGEEGSVPAPDRFSRKRDLVPRWDQYRPGRVMVGVLGFREGSGSVLVRTLIYLKTSSDQRRKSVVALLEHESRTIPVL